MYCTTCLNSYVTHACMHKHTCTHTHTHARTHTHTCHTHSTHTHTPAHTRTHTRTHTHTGDCHKSSKAYPQMHGLRKALMKYSSQAQLYSVHIRTRHNNNSTPRARKPSRTPPSHQHQEKNAHNVFDVLMYVLSANHNLHRAFKVL